MTCCQGLARMSAVSAMKWTPQKIMYFAFEVSAATLRELVAVPGEVGEADHLVALVMVAKQGDIGAKRGARAAAIRASMLWSGMGEVMVERACVCSSLGHDYGRSLFK